VREIRATVSDIWLSTSDLARLSGYKQDVDDRGSLSDRIDQRNSSSLTEGAVISAHAKDKPGGPELWEPCSHAGLGEVGPAGDVCRPALKAKTVL
jgi:hypothetical protein